MKIKEEALGSAAGWYFQCFGETANPLKVAKRLEEYFALCQMRTAAKREFGVALSERALRGAFWWDGEWTGKPVSCLVTEREAMCKWGKCQVEICGEGGDRRRVHKARKPPLPGVD
ncbi:paREP2a [Pyrobaculum aerophilum str. IM2]|uniref:PaREP2a n=1 Tax=Pyrobaculum aerophilum (strain ATCC 51768 / DSM 7523 / JCM 9630 / CIP 104966 / NBRC 100827 / IM2) TaxID=178306 RepID=Q8ZWN6_PYRAE|nr:MULTISPECIES: PaRep2a protein [Pyrobaculum]AAL63664.1 paREP2a [Pyrobaculum aerophilum str. IM2]MCX8136458.1 PaRep2a protein [Pyrobaculum aerophilum]